MYVYKYTHTHTHKYVDVYVNTVLGQFHLDPVQKVQKRPQVG